MRDVLDADERPRVEFDDTWTLVIMRISIENKDNGVAFYTIPLGVSVTDNFTLALCNKDNEIFPFKQASLFKEKYHQMTDVYNFILRLFLRSGGTYL